MPLFNTPSRRTQSKATQMITSLKSNCALFSRLYIACQTRDGDVDNFFKHENHAYPPSLSQVGKLRFGTKADLTDCLEKLCTSKGEAPVIDVIILDGVATINMLKPVGANTFQDYAMLVFLPYIKAQLARVTRVDIIWDVYIPDSLKSTARENRGNGVRRRVAAANSIQGNWQEFLLVDENKTELINFLAHEVVVYLSTEKEVFSTCGKHVLCPRVHQDVSALAPCCEQWIYPESWGWSKNPTRVWEPMWTLLPQAAVSCSDLLRCGCKKGCRGLCKCVKANLKCTSLCHCCGNWEHSDHY